MAARIQFDQTTGHAGLRISIFSELDGRTTDLLFNQFPIRIGRNRLNDLVLFHEYVSQWHAAIGFVQGQLSILQVGSSNSVRVDGRKLTPEELFPLKGNEMVRIVPFSLQLQVVTLPQALAGVQPSRQGEPGPTPQARGRRDLPSAMPDLSDMPDLLQGRGDPGPFPPSGGGLQAGGTALADLSRPAARAPGPTPIEGEALRVLQRLAERYLGQPLGQAHDLALFGQRLEQVLDIFLRFFVALQRGQLQFYHQMNVSPRDGQLSPVEQAGTSVVLGNLLLSPRNPDAPRDLEDAFETLKVHQLALLGGLEAGVKFLLKRLSPQTVAQVASKVSRLSGVKAFWETYTRIHTEMSEEDQERFAVIYGPAFRAAYLGLLQAGAQARKG